MRLLGRQSRDACGCGALRQRAAGPTVTGSGPGRPPGCPGCPAAGWENDFDIEQARKVLHSRTTTPPQDELDTAKVGAGK